MPPRSRTSSSRSRVSARRSRLRAPGVVARRGAVPAARERSNGHSRAIAVECSERACRGSLGRGRRWGRLAAHEPDQPEDQEHDADGRDDEPEEAEEEREQEPDDDEGDGGEDHGPGLLQIDDDEALFGELANRVRGALLRVPRLLDAAVRHLVGPERRRLVDRHPSEIELLGGAQCGLEAARVDPGLEPVLGPVRELDRFVEGSIPVHGDDRAEDLLARDLQRRVRVRDHGRLDELPFELAAREDLRAGGPRLVDPLEDPFARVLVDHRPDVGLLVGGIPDGQRLDLRDELRDEVLIDLVLHVDALDRDAALTREREAVGRHRRGGRADVGIGPDDDRRRVAELERNPLARRALGQLPADAARAREGQDLDAVVLDEDVADLRRRADDDVQPAGRQARLGLQLGEEQRGQRRLRGGLEDDGAAGGERGRNLVGDEVQREVERADRPDDPARPPDRVRELALPGLRRAHRDDLAGELPRLDGRERVRRHRALCLDPRSLHRFARLVGDLARDLVVPLSERARDTHEDLRPLVRRKRLAHRLFGGVDRAARFLGAGFRNPADDVAGVGRALVTLAIYAKRLWSADYPWAPTPEAREAEIEWIERTWGDEMDISSLAPTADEAFKRRAVTYLRRSASPGAAVALLRMNSQIDVREVLPTIQVPTLVLQRVDDRDVNVEEGRWIAQQIPGAKYVELLGDEHLIWAGDVDAVVDEVEEFLTGTRPVHDTDRVLATVLFTDIVASTERATELGDRKWSSVLEQHNALVRRGLERFRGREVDTAGDGFLATFDGPARAIRCACAVRDSLRSLDLEIRAGLHTGECELVGDKVGGIAVHTAARVVAAAGPSQVLVSSTVKDLVSGSGIRFEDRGEFELKGVGAWRLYSVLDA